MIGRVVVVNSSSRIGGAELSLLPVMRVLAEQVEVVALLPGSGPLHDELRATGAETMAFPLGRRLERASRQYGTSAGPSFLAAALRQQLDVTRLLRRLRPSVVYCNGFRAQLGATAPAATLRIPTVWHVRDFVPARTAGRAWRLLATRAAAVIANSEATSRQPLLRGRKVITIPNGIDLGAFAPRLCEPAPPPTLGMAGHLTPWKGHLRFLDVVGRIRDRMPDVRGAIAGGDVYDTAAHHSYEARVHERVRELGLEGVVELRHVTAAEMPSWLASLSVLVHCPDRPEPFGRVLAEALAVGVPVVAAAGAGADEVIGNAGVALPIGADEDLVDAVAALLADPGRRAELADAGVERARTRFDEQRYAQESARVVLAAGSRQGAERRS